MRGIREDKRLSQTDIANAMEVLPTQYNKVENGKVSPSLDTLVKISDALEIDLDIIVFGKYRFLQKDEEALQISDKDLTKKLKVISELPDEEKYIANQLIDLIITKRTLKDLTENLYKKMPGKR
ncbi:MAG: helix-turn-helix transcriptional regulator [Bacteroidota bacterium]|nr:helix-turn-helix transcriptional regulator [Bacteroidota bacterium]